MKEASVTEPMSVEAERSGAVSVSIVVPVYNAEGTLRALCERLKPVLSSVARRYEIILVNDGSGDGSWGVIRKLVAENDYICGVNFMRNYGQHNALLCGIRAAKCDVVITMDDDLQNPPEEIPKLLVKLAEGCDVVYGKRSREQHGFFRNLASRTTKLALQGTMGAATARSVTSFRAFRTQLRDAFASHQNPHVCIDVLLTWATTRFGAVVVEHNQREVGQSGYSISRLTTHALNMMTGFSTLPLRIASVLGFGFTLFGVGVLIYVIGRYFIQGGSVEAGFTFLASTIAIFAGAQLFALGIIGEYLSRMHSRMMERPPYAVEEYALPGDKPDGAESEK